MRKLSLALAALFVLGASACASFRPAPGPGHSARYEKAQQERRAATSEATAVRHDEEVARSVEP